MPKIIDEARERILAEARKTLLTAGYKGLSLRGLARDCSVAVGTIYNYFPNKDTLIALVMMQDWTEARERMERGVDKAPAYRKELWFCIGKSTAFLKYIGMYSISFPRPPERRKRSAAGCAINFQEEIL